MTQRWPVRHPGIGVIYYDSEEEARIAAGTAGEMLPPESGVPDEVNAVLTFEDETGGRWLAGALLGPLVREDDMAETMSVEATKDRAFVLVSFKVVSS